MKPLIPFGDLLTFGFKTIKETWKPTLKYTVWFILFPIMYGALVLGSLTVPRAIATYSLIGVSGIGLILLLVGFMWASIGLVQYMLAYSKGVNMRSWQPKQSPLMYIPGILWLSLLAMLPAIGFFAVVMLPIIFWNDSGAGWGIFSLLFLAAVVASIWIGILFSQAQLLLLEDDVRGVGALKGSIGLVKGRWWATFGRLVGANVVFQFIVSAVVSMLNLLLSFTTIATGSFVESDLQTLLASPALLGFYLLILFVMIAIQAAGFLLQILFQTGISARVFHSLKESR